MSSSRCGNFCFKLAPYGGSTGVRVLKDFECGATWGLLGDAIQLGLVFKRNLVLSVLQSWQWSRLNPSSSECLGFGNTDTCLCDAALHYLVARGRCIEACWFCIRFDAIGAGDGAVK